MKKLAIAAAVALMVGGCASAPKQPPAPKKKPVADMAVPVDRTPNQEVQRRWYDRFKMHPRSFR